MTPTDLLRDLKMTLFKWIDFLKTTMGSHPALKLGKKYLSGFATYGQARVGQDLKPLRRLRIFQIEYRFEKHAHFHERHLIS